MTHRLKGAAALALALGLAAPALAQVFGGVPGHILSAASTNATIIKPATGTLLTVSWLQTTTTLMDIRFYDTATTPNCASATGVKLNFVAQSNAVSAGGAPPLPPSGVQFLNGIGVCITGANADNDSTNAVTGLNLNFTFQ